MKKAFSIFLLLFISFGTIVAQDTTTVTATSDDISEDLDLEAVASIFGESKDLEDFEKRLNDPESKISNLDLNGDGEVDYLRVVDNSKGETKTVAIQAVIGKDKYQDVAVIDIVKDKKGETTVQVVGDVYMYGDAYIVQPVYVTPPVIVTWFWMPIYSPWHSPYYWGYYPPYFSPWRVMARTAYRHHAYRHHHHSYRHTSVRISHNSVTINNNNRRNDYARNNPNNSFDKRNKGVSNKAALDKSNRAATTNNKANNRSSNNKNKASTNNRTKPSTSNKKDYKSTGRKTNNNWQSPSNNRSHTRPSNNQNQTRSTQSRPSSSHTRSSQSRTRSTPNVGGSRGGGGRRR